MSDDVTRKRKSRERKRRYRAKKKQELDEVMSVLYKNPDCSVAHTKLRLMKEKSVSMQISNSSRKRLRRITILDGLPDEILSRVSAVSIDLEGNKCVSLVKVPKRVLTVLRFLLKRNCKGFCDGIKLQRIRGLRNATVKDGDGIGAWKECLLNNIGPDYRRYPNGCTDDMITDADMLLHVCIQTALEEMCGINVKEQKIWHMVPSTLDSVDDCADPQDCHTDIDTTIKHRRLPTTRDGSGRCLDDILSEHEKRPFISVFPLTSEGSLLNVWNEYVSEPVKPVLLFIPYGYIPNDRRSGQFTARNFGPFFLSPQS